MLDPNKFVSQNFKQGTPNTDEIHSMFRYLGRNYKPKSILEIGFLKGASATWFLETFPNTKVTSVDMVIRATEDHVIHEEMKRRYPSRFKFHYGDSSIITDFYQPGYFDFAYIDGNHTFEGCQKDLDMCLALDIPVLLFDNVEYWHKDPITKQVKDGVRKAIVSRQDKLKFIKKFHYHTENRVTGNPDKRMMELYHVLSDDIQVT